MPAPAVVLSAVRTPWGRLMGSLSDVSGPELGALAISEAIRRSGLASTDIDRVYLGNVHAHGAGGNPAGAACTLAELRPAALPVTLRLGCASGLAAVALAIEAIAGGRARAVLAGGFESCSRAPHLALGLRGGLRLGGGVLRDAARLDGPAPDQTGGRPPGSAEAAAGPERKDEGICAVHLPRPVKGRDPDVTADETPGEEPSGNGGPPLADGAAALVIADASWAGKRGLHAGARLSVVDDAMEMVRRTAVLEADLPSGALRKIGDALRGESAGGPRSAAGAAPWGHAAGADGARALVSMLHRLEAGSGLHGLALAGDASGAMVGIEAVA